MQQKSVCESLNKGKSTGAPSVVEIKFFWLFAVYCCGIITGLLIAGLFMKYT